MAALHTSLIAGRDQTPGSPWLLAVHGIFGSGGNLKTMARALVEVLPTWSILLIDLRGHGRSLAGDPPQTMASAANDLVELAHRERGEGRHVCAVLGHSLGGKVALAVREQAPPWLEATVVLDSSPSARPGALQDTAHQNTVPRVLRLLESMPSELASREAFVARIEREGFPQSMAQWLAMNLERTEDGVRLGIDLQVMRDLLTDYYARDMWNSLAGGSGSVCVVVAEKSEALASADQTKLAALVANNPSVFSAVIADAGHWLHAEKPTEVANVVAEFLRRLPP